MKRQAELESGGRTCAASYLPSCMSAIYSTALACNSNNWWACMCHYGQAADNKQLQTVETFGICCTMLVLSKLVLVHYSTEHPVSEMSWLCIVTCIVC